MTALLLCAIGALLLSAICGLWPDGGGPRRHPAALGSAVLTPLGCAAFAALAARSLAGAPLSAAIALGPGPLPLAVALPPLSAAFVLLGSAVGFLAALYGAAYTARLAPPKRRSVRAFLPLFVLSMALVPLAADLAAFLVAWEAMSLCSYALVMTDADRPEVVRAGYVYLLMTHLGALCLLGAFLLLASAAGSTSFAAWALAAPHLAPGLRDAVFLLALGGFGSKAALVPLHVWLPRAHPVAPSHVSGLMSGVMLKIAVYGLILIGAVVLGPGPLWWGLAVLGLGVASALLGVLYAVTEHDLKRLLAFHSVENVGIIAIGLGVALVARNAGLPAVAALALAAALYHCINHALFKTALFLDAGAIEHGGAGRNLDAMGGLLRAMPWTGASLCVASAAISGLPPFNGFVSEWMTFQALFRLAARGGPALALCAFAAVLGLALTGGLAAACFVKAAGTALLGRPRTAAAAAAHEAPPAMWGPALVLAGLCVAVGLIPGALGAPLGRLAAELVAGGGAGPAASQAVLLALPWGGPRLVPLAFVAAAAAVALAVGGASAIARRGRPAPAVRPAWACGGVLGLESQYTAAAFSDPFRQVFRTLYRPVRHLRVEQGAHPLFPERVEYEAEITHVVDRYLYAPAVAAALAAARLARRLQSGSLRLYLGYLLLSLVLLLALVR